MISYNISETNVKASHHFVSYENIFVQVTFFNGLWEIGELANVRKQLQESKRFVFFVQSSGIYSILEV